MNQFPFFGAGWGFGQLPFLSKAKTRSISAENFTGEKGKGGMAEKGFGEIPARELGKGWKMSPCITLGPNAKATVADIEGPGIIQHIWITTFKENWRKIVVRIYWDDQEHPSVEVPLGDFFCMGWKEHSNVISIPVCVNPTGGLNCYWPMPFYKKARIVVENITPDDLGMFFYQISYALTDLPEGIGHFHAQFRRTNPVPYKDVYTIIDDIKGHGHYVGTYVAWQANNEGWWGEGELKFFLDGDKEYPTICGTGTEDYFGGAWGFENPPGTYNTYTTPFLGFHQHVGGDMHTKQGRRFGMYRWHMMDPIIFQEDLRITMQALGIGNELEGKGRYRCLQDDIASVAYWYQTLPTAPFPEFPTLEYLEIV